MSQCNELLEIDKCIASKLWFTALVLHETASNRSVEKDNDVTDYGQSELVITSLINSQVEEQYCWITHTLLNKLISNNLSHAKDNVEQQSNIIQMAQALRMCENVPLHVQQEFLSLYNTNEPLKVSRDSGKEWRDILKEKIYRKPDLICWIINQLLEICQSESPDGETNVANLYAELLQDQLRYFTLAEQREDALLHEHYFGSFLCILSKMIIDGSKLNNFATSIFPDLLKIKDFRDVELCIYSREDKRLFGKWCEFLDERQAHYKKPDNLNDVSTIYENLCRTKDGSTPTLSKNQILQRLAKAKSLWLSDILDICCIFLMDGRQIDVSSVLSSPILKHFSPILLFQFLNEVPCKDGSLIEAIQTQRTICESIKFLLHRSNFDVSHDKTLMQLNRIIKNYVKIAEYIVNWKTMTEGVSDNTKSPVEKNISFSTSVQFHSIKPIFSLLCHSNVLTVLKSITNIHEQEYQLIQNLLQELGKPRHIYQAYSCILNALKAILSYDSSDTKDTLARSYFSQMEYLLQTLYPLSVRVETLQNVFTLLFLQYEYFNDYQNNLDDENISTSDEKSKSDGRQFDQEAAGFLCNKYAIRDLLLRLKECVAATEFELYKKKNTGQSDETDKNTERDLFTIKLALNDVRRRLELHTNTSFVSGLDSEDAEKANSFMRNQVIMPQHGIYGQVPSRSKHVRFYREESTSDGTKTKTDSSSESGIHGSSKLKRRSKTLPMVMDSFVTKDISHEPILVNLMLATNDSLVVQCLWKGDYDKGEQVMQMSEKKNIQLSAELRFSKGLRAFKESVLRSAHAFKENKVSLKNTQPSTLDNIRLAAKEGMESSRYTNQLETFLASQEANLQMLVGENLSGDEVLTLCVIDLALTVCRDSTASTNLCDVAMKYLRLCESFDNTEHARFFAKVYQLLHENKSGSCLANLLCDSRVPLSAKEYKERSNFWHDIASKHSEFRESQANKDTINEILKDNKLLPGIRVLERTVSVFGGSVSYVQCIMSHLQTLHNIIPADSAILTVSDMLKLPLHYYFGHQMFELEVEPSQLEPIAQNLQVNLAYSILVNACPKLDCSTGLQCELKRAESGCIILNQNLGESRLPNLQNTSVSTQSPNECVSEILTELLEALNNLSPNQSSIPCTSYKTLGKDPTIQYVLGKTSRLVHLDLSELSVGAETLTFFVNTWNIMFLHTNLVLWMDDPPFNKLRHTVSLMSAGYIIGDLGLVTLHALRTKLLNNSLSNDEAFLHIEELNEPAWQDLDITYEPRVIFAMANEFHGTPRVRICNASSLGNDLANAVREYIQYYASPNISSCASTQDKPKRVQFPDLVRRYQNSIEQKDGEENRDDKVSSVGDFLDNFDKNVTIEYAPLSYSFDTLLRYSNYTPTNSYKKAESSLPTWQNRSLKVSLLQYLEGHCWMLSHILQRMYSENLTSPKNRSNHLRRTACLENVLNSRWVAKAKPLFENNETFTVICDASPSKNLWPYLESISSNEKWLDCLDLLNALPDNYLANNEVHCLKDKTLSRLTSSKDTAASPEILQYLYQIKDIHILVQTILQNVSKWQVQTCQYALLHALHHVDCDVLPAHCKLRMKETLRRVLIFNKMLPYCVGKSSSTWYDVAYCTSKIEPFQIIKTLISADKFELCLEWLECQSFSLEIQSSVTQDFLIGLLKNESQNFKQASKLLRALPLGQSIKMCKGVMRNMESIDALQFVANFLLEHCRATKTIKYRRTLLGIDVLRMLEEKERPLYMHLIKEPLLMLEQLLMDCKFESIQRILSVVREKFPQVDIPISTFDKTIRFYAERSLDFRVSLQRDTIESKSRTAQPSTSDAESTEFVVPTVVPTKEEWIPNEKARECSCCKTVIFSMFNRRHHCRRCGRVICAVCSQHRMHVKGYPQSVAVRVCDDCKRQTVLQMRAVQGTASTTSSELTNHWRLTRDETHNQTIREEFSFEHAPNISLCLAILNLHSDHKAYTSFLLDRCDEMKKLMRPVSGDKVNPEVDHIVLIKMIRSLLIAAKVKCAKLSWNTGIAHCDRFLSQVDLIATLVESDCLNLIPTDNLDEHALRKLRDLLIEREQWKLALDVSTKAGLDTQGVWATWGKACLKMGYFEQAREKFFHCLDKIIHEDVDDWVVFSYPRDIAVASERKETKSNDLAAKKIEAGRNRPLKDPPLLTEILQILDNLSIHRQYVQNTIHSKPSTAQEILNTFGNLKITGQSQFMGRRSSDTSQDVYYQESLYYLLTYGSFNSTLDFFLKHEEYDKCLLFILENDLDPELFFNSVYVYTLRNGCTAKLHEAMKLKDPSLLTWKKYLITVCYNLERRQYLHILYQLQLFMKDSIRAAMTCIRFYVSDATDYTDLRSRSDFLMDAQRHLESELQIEMLSKRRRKSAVSLTGSQGIFTMEMEPLEIDKHINTISRQMEIAKFLANCEKEERLPSQLLMLFPDIDNDANQTLELPTLFGNQQQKVHLAVLAILCGRDIGEGFGIAFRIMQDYNLPQQKVYSLAGHVLALQNNIEAIEQLIKCCHTSGTPSSHVISDNVLTHCIKLFLNRSYSGSDAKNQVDSLIRLITDIELKINAYIESKQLKTAYLLAVKRSRAQDIRRILKEADRLGQTAIKTICTKWLQRETELGAAR